MTDKSWKAFERELAKFFKTVRNALSGGNSKQTRSDTCHQDLYVEAKHGLRIPGYALYKETQVKAKKEKKIPVLCFKKTGTHGFLILVHCDDLNDVAHFHESANS